MEDVSQLESHEPQLDEAADLRRWRLSVNLSSEDVAAKVREKGLQCGKRTYEEMERGWRRGSYELLAAIAGLSNGALNADALRRRPLKIESSAKRAA
jgi:transcriptional regulator with XRE-family HTH domain